jgi:antitoxin Phd
VIKINIDTRILVPMTEANENFLNVVRLVDENGMVVISMDNQPRYMMLNFSEYDEIFTERQKRFNEAADNIIAENLEALTELAK